MNDKFNDLQKRVITAAALIVPIGVLYLSAGTALIVRELLSVLGLAIVVGAAWEFVKLADMPSPLRWAVGIVSTFGAVLAVIGFFLGAVGGSVIGSIALGTTTALLSLWLVLLAILYASRLSTQPLLIEGGEVVLGATLIGVGGAALCALPSSIQGFSHVVWLVAVICSSDTAAYFGGSSIGGPKLAPAVSPQKTISGSLCGLLAAALVGGILAPYLLPGAHSLFGLVGAVLTASVGQSGDLVKSLCKRIHGKKDSGTLFPGHGGVLDRFDGILSGAPAVLALLAFLEEFSRSAAIIK